MKTWIKQPAATWTGNSLNAADGVVVEDDKIVELVDGQPSVHCDAVFDAANCVLLPGLINCHHHFYQTLTRALPGALNKELFPWLQSLYPVWANLNDELVEISTRTALAELMLSGCTTASDHHYVFPAAAQRAIDQQVMVASELGMRVILTRGSMSLSEKDGGLPPDTVVQDQETILLESERLINAYHDPSTGAMIQIALAPCSPFSVTPELMQESARLARRQGVMLHTHLAETEDENSFCLETFGRRPLDYLEEVEWLADDVWLAHGIHFDNAEIERLGQSGVAICHCPSSNMMLASGSCRVNELKSASVAIGLGVDGSASNDVSNMMQEVRQAFLLQRLQYGSAAFSHDDALHLATTGGARLFGRSDIGQIAPGYQADLALFSLDDLQFAGSGDPIAALVLCGAHRAEAVMVNGQWTVKDQTLLSHDLDQLIERQQAAAVRLMT